MTHNDKIQTHLMEQICKDSLHRFRPQALTPVCLGQDITYFTTLQRVQLRVILFAVLFNTERANDLSFVLQGKSLFVFDSSTYRSFFR